MSNYSILRIGPLSSDNDGNAAILRDAILSHFQKQNDTPSSSSCTDNKLSISNRYFNANILLSPLEEDDTITTEGVEDGMILIFDGTSSSNFDKLTSIHTKAVSKKEYGDLLRLCISTTYGPSPLSNGTKSSEEEYSKRVLWCLDHGYEYVEVNLNEEGMTTGFDERDKDGFARVCEAVGSCMWSCHVMKPRNGVGVSKSGRSSGVGPSEVDKTESQTNNTPANKDGEKDEAVKSSTVTTVIDDTEREEAAVASLMKDMTNPNDTQPPSNPQEQPQTNHQKEEIAFHQLESVLSEAKSIRDASKSTSMSDDERRERAGDTAMKLMGLLDSMGFCDDSDDDDGEDVDSSDDES